MFFINLLFLFLLLVHPVVTGVSSSLNSVNNSPVDSSVNRSEFNTVCFILKIYRKFYCGFVSDFLSR